jgi:hypothetical protein
MEVAFDANTGALVSRSSEFLDPAQIQLSLSSPTNIKVTVEHNRLTYTLAVGNLSQVHAAVDHVVSAFACALSTTMGVYVDVVKLLGSVTGQLTFTSIIALRGSNYSYRYVALDAFSRDQRLRQGLGLLRPWSASYPRLMIASMYYQHAMRFVSPHVVNCPSSKFLSEVVVNLSKTLEILFGGRGEGPDHGLNDRVRVKCQALGYTNQQIEGQIIPILLIRSQFDGAHAVGRRIPPEDILYAQNFVHRSLDNVRAILISTVQRTEYDDEFLEPLSSNNDDRRQRLCEGIKSYLDQPPLPGPQETKGGGSGLR